MPVPREEVAERCGLDPDLMDQADAILSATPYTVVRYGQLCWSGGYPTGTTTTHQVWSITKTLGGLLVGMVAARSSLDDTDPITDWVDEDDLGAINPEATVAHVLAMTATEEDLSHGAKGPWSYDLAGDREIDVLVGVMNRVIEEEPDAFPGVSNIAEFAQVEVFDRMGMAGSNWPGQSIAGTMVSTSEDLARLGLLLLRRGMWDGEALLDERYVYRMTHPAFEDTNTGYGYLTYVNAAEDWTYSTGTADLTCSPYATWPSYPHAPFFEEPDAGGGTPFDEVVHDIGMAFAAGAGGQRISVHRGLDLVITARDGVVSTDPDDPGFFEGHKSIWAAIRPALVALDPTFDGDEDAFCEAYRRSAYAPDLLDPWSASASQGAVPAPVPDGTGAGDSVEEALDDDTPEAAEPDASTTGEQDTAPPGPTSTPLPVTGGVGGLLAGLLGLAAAGALRRRA
ncbi:serine hydrolase [Nitriliruptor alkaliphilus]|uniref:serine hydrolase n=1 Tax=Nitriliruptor alkaliphilus TaxID=427918 RepID=UPI0012EDBF4B|nr:serine hydrolase [Nitriliruptor alkaliphilus]